MRPFIFDYAKTCNGNDATPIFNYDWNKNLNVIKVNGNVVPFISACSKLDESKTKSFTGREGDDVMALDAISDAGVSEKNVKRDYYNFCELLTKTKAPREQDDNSI